MAVKWDVLAKQWYAAVAAEQAQVAPDEPPFRLWEELTNVERAFYTRTVQELIRTYLGFLSKMLPRA